MVPQWIIDSIGPPPPQPRTENPLHDNDPSNDHEADAWLDMANRWRDWARQEEDLVAKGLEKGNSLDDLGYFNRKDEGKSMHSRFGAGGFFSEYGANVDPGFEYDWARGMKINRGTADKNIQWVPITAGEWQGYRQAQQNKAAGLNTYGEQATRASFDRIKKGHFTQDPKTGNWYNVLPTGQVEWVDQYGRRINNPRAGTGTTWLQEQGGGNASANRNASGVSAYGNGLPSGAGGSGGGGYFDSMGGMDPYGMFGGGFGGGFGSPGQEAQSWGQANLNNAMSEQIRNDILAQQLQLQKGLEGRALGGSIYDYLLNDVYGKVLGVNFNPNREGVAQFSQGLNQQIQQPTYGTAYQQGTVDVPVGQVGKAPAEDQPMKTGLYTEKEAASQYAGPEVGKEPQVAKEAAATAGQGQTAAPSGQVGKVQSGTGSGLYVEKEAASNYAGDTVGKSVLDEFERDLESGAVPKESSRTAIEQELQRNPDNQRAQQLMQRMNVLWPKQTGQGAPTVSGMGSKLPMGSYTQGGTQSFDPNMNSTWARFLAPTYNKVGEMTQQNVDRLKREMPRGGEQNRSVSDAITSGYKTMQQGWQSMVPTALAGVSGIGQEMYFQQPSPNSGATGIASSHQLGLQNLKENQRQFDVSRQDAKDAQPSFWERMGGGVANYVQGNMQAGGQAMMSLSDARAKKDVRGFERGLAELKQLDAVAFDYNGKFGSVDGTPGVSVMAQQLEKIIPEAVVKVKTPDGPARMILPLALQMATINAVKDLDRKISDFAKERK